MSEPPINYPEALARLDEITVRPGETAAQYESRLAAMDTTEAAKALEQLLTSFVHTLAKRGREVECKPSYSLAFVTLTQEVHAWQLGELPADYDARLAAMIAALRAAHESYSQPRVPRESNVIGTGDLALAHSQQLTR